MSGVQSILVKLLQSAAPQLVEQANQIGDMIKAFKAQTDRIEANQKIIMRHLNIMQHEGEQNGDARGSVGGIAGEDRGSGKQTGQ